MSAQLPPIVVMGVSGAGKSTIGRAIADRAQVIFVDGDDLHPAANKTKMQAGIPLDDADRTPWLTEIGTMLGDGRAQVVACSALRRRYRDHIRNTAPGAFFVHLAGPAGVVATRVHDRAHEFMPTSLLGSQFELLEPLEADEDGIEVDITERPEEIVDRVFTALGARDA